MIGLLYMDFMIITVIKFQKNYCVDATTKRNILYELKLRENICKIYCTLYRPLNYIRKLPKCKIPTFEIQ